MFDESHAVYGVKGVTAIPLTEDRARIALNTLASRNDNLARPSLLQTNTMDTISHSLDAPSELNDSTNVVSPPTTRVQFSDEDQIKVLTPRSVHEFNLNDDEEDDAESVASSEHSTPSSSEYSIGTSPVAKTLASRLSFWSRLSKRTSVPAIATGNESLTLLEEQQKLDEIIHEGKEEPAEVLESILAATAPAPVSSEEKTSELEEKIVKECIKEFTKGGMYFAYNFGQFLHILYLPWKHADLSFVATDITRSLQHKQERVATSQKQNALLADLNALPDTPSTTSFVGDKVSALAEPYPTLPLWRRVDRQFWWNEWMSKPFVDAGVSSILYLVRGFIDEISHSFIRMYFPSCR